MKKTDISTNLREKAEQIHQNRKVYPPDESDKEKLIHELSVHQIELELQNEELIKARLSEKDFSDKYRQLYDFAPAGYLTLTMDGKIVELNLGAAKMLGRERANLKKASFTFFLTSDTRDDFRSFLNIVAGSSFSVMCQVTLENNIDLHLTGIRDNDFINLTAVDITHIRKIEKENRQLLSELLDARKKLDLTLENARIGSWEWKYETNTISIDSSAADLFGFERTKKSIIFTEFEKCFFDDDILLLRDDFRNAFSKQIPLESVLRIRDKEEKTKYLSVKAHINFDQNNKPLGLTGVCIDITKIHESSEKALLKLNAELIKSNKELQNFAYIASHDLQEPLRMVTSFVQLLEQQYAGSLDDRAREFINFAVQGAKRMYDLLNSLLAYSRTKTRQNDFSQVDMNEVLGKVIDNLKIVINERGAKIQVKKLPIIKANGSQMIQLMQNLIENSIKFSKNTPEITVSSKKNREHYVFEVKDKGIGIEPEYFERIFRIFQRLHPSQEYSGTGVGLAICKSIAERHGGSIWLESEPGRGTTFFISLPVKPENEESV